MTFSEISGGDSWWENDCGFGEVSMKRERMSCVVMVTFNALIYVGVLLSFRWFSKSALTQVAECNIRKIGCKVKKKKNHRMLKIIFPKFFSVMWKKIDNMEEKSVIQQSSLISEDNVVEPHKKANKIIYSKNKMINAHLETIEFQSIKTQKSIANIAHSKNFGLPSPTWNPPKSNPNLCLNISNPQTLD